jgi:hypothetical protein
MADELAQLANAIKENEEERKEVRAAIKIIRRGDDAAVKALGYGSRDEAREHLAPLEAKEARLDGQLKSLYDTRLAAQQQQSGAGTSMLPVRQELVMFPCQSSCRMHQHTLQLSECVSVCERFQTCTAAMTHCKLDNKYAVQCTADLLMYISFLLLMLCVRCCARSRSASR